ncbi:aminotransferase class V-fold PLP-dependent enzyme [Chloroflexi bacterium TSY]|nr:aminotransferase class V-fold PLP-dependent enzyme [Chloroflexi bacterium TSY]
MPTLNPKDIYSQLGIKPIINASGNQTLLGGSTLSPGVQAAMEAANAVYAPMEEVLEKSGAAIAKMMGAEGGYVTSGCYAALVLSVASVMAGDDPDKIMQLPDTSGMKNEFLLQKKTRYHYDRCISAAGGKLIEMGDETGTTAEQLEAAINSQTAGILFFAAGEKIPDTLPLKTVISIAQKHNLAVIVDAAAEIYPLERMTNLVNSGADLLCFGAKYLGSANSAGILCGKKDRVHAATLHNFISYETKLNRSMARGYKIDRQEVVATVVALDEWLTMDHEERLQEQAERIQTISGVLAGVPHITAENAYPDEGGAWMRLRVKVDTDALGKTPDEVVANLRAGDPSIWTRADGDKLFIGVHTLREGEVEIVADRLKQELSV